MNTPTPVLVPRVSRLTHHVLLALLAVLLAGGATPVRGQSALDGFDPNANGRVYAVVVQPDGKILVGGDFTTLAPNGGASITRNRIARLNPDGTLDSAFNPNANGSVNAIAVQADGKILVGGNFTTMGGQTRNRLARLDPITGAADSFDPDASALVRVIALQSDGKILAGGDFTSIGGQPRNRMARLDPVTGTADSFNPNADFAVYSITVLSDGRILAGGNFSTLGGQSRSRVARLDPVTGLADTFDPNASNIVRYMGERTDGKIIIAGDFPSLAPNGGAAVARRGIALLNPNGTLDTVFNASANSSVLTVGRQADGKVVVGGEFTSIGGQMRNRIARLDPTTGLADSFNPNASGVVESIAVQADGKVLAVGNFISLTPSGGSAVARNRIARLEADGRVDQTLSPGIAALGGQTPAVYATAVQPDGKILIGGNFFLVLGVERANIARLNRDGTLDTAFNPNANHNVYSIAVQADGKILVGGFFTSIGGQPRNDIARLDPVTGAADSFNPNANGGVTSIAVQADGKILVCGSFKTIGGQERVHIARLDATTGSADSFNPSLNANAFGIVDSIAVQADGKILVGGRFSTIGGQARTNIARVDATIGLADSFNPNANGAVRSIVVQADGKILVGGAFTNIGGQARGRMARLDATTGLADSFNPDVGAAAFPTVDAIAVQADGKILVGGFFTTIGGQTRGRIARLDVATGLADSFNPSANDWVTSLAMQADGKILVAGRFTSIGGQTRSRFARLSNDTPPVQTVAVTQTGVNWTLGGSSPQFSRVTFEDSTDGVNFNFLGNGTAAGSNWTLTGLNLSLGRIDIRARGYYPGGQYNGSESIQESVRNVFLTLPPPSPRLNIQRSGSANVVLSWPASATGFTLEAKPNLNANVWSAVSPAPAVSGTNNVVTDATTEARKFYRLRKP